MKHPACGLVDNTAHPKIFISVCDMGLVEIDTGDHFMTEQHLALRVGIRHRAQGDRQAAQCLADAEGPAAITESALGLYFAQPETIGPDSTWMTHLGAAKPRSGGAVYGPDVQVAAYKDGPDRHRVSEAVIASE